MSYSSIVVPKTAKISVSRQHALGVANYDIEELYSPDTDYWQSKVLDLGSPKYSPNKTYWFDRSRYRNHGTITGATWVQLPSGVWVLSFDGNDYISLGNNLNFATSFTLEGWIKNSQTAAAAQPIISKGTTNKYQYILGLDTNGYGLIGVYKTTGVDHVYKLGSTNLRDNLWHHIVGVYTLNTSATLIVDGVLIGTSTTVSGAMGSGDATCMVGSRADAAQWYTGIIGGIGAYTRALTLGESIRNKQRTKWRYS